MSEITVRLFGGLGNQLFQYFAGLDLSLKSGLPLSIDSRWIEASYSQDGSDIRDFKFIDDAQDRNILNSGKLNYGLERVKTKIAMKSKIAEKFFAISSPSSTGFVELNGFETGVELRGYYQSHKYFENVFRNFGVNNWSLRNESNSFLKIKSLLSNTPFIALHVRGGDYLAKAHSYHTLESSYYLDSLKEIKHWLNHAAVYVFSDDAEHAQKVLKNIPGLKFIDQTGLRASEVILLMSVADGIIIANSTFSYWAAMINASNHIIAPKLWYANKLVDVDLYPSGWTIV